MRDPRTTIQSCLRLSVDKGATVGERAAARAMAEKLSRIHGVKIDGPYAAGFTYAEEMKKAYTKVGTIQDYCYQVLARDFGDAGYSYAEVLRMVAARFPNSKTSVNSLRWYETRMRKSGLHVPKRKRKPSNR